MRKSIRLACLIAMWMLFLLYPQGALAQGAILTSEAADRIGETLTVCGTVASSYQAVQVEKRPLYVNLDRTWPESPFLLVSGGQGLSKLPLERLTVGQPVCATGLIASSPKSGKPYILIMEPEQLELMNIRTNAADALKYQGQYVTVYGKVASARYEADTETKRTFLNLDSPYPLDPAVIVIPAANRPHFGKPEQELLGKMIAVKGIIQKSNKGRALIQLLWPVQLAVEP